MGGVCPLCGVELRSTGHVCSTVQVTHGHTEELQAVRCHACGQSVAGIVDVRTGKPLKQPDPYTLYRRIRNAEKALKRVLRILDGEIRE